MQNSLFITTILLLPSLAFAVVNIESQRPTYDTEGYHSAIAIGASGSSGNSDKLVFDLSAQLGWYYQPQQTFLIGKYRYGESFSVKDTNQAFVHLRHSRQLWESHAWEAFSQVESDEFKRLNFRGLAGGGFRWTLWQGVQKQLSLGTGAFYSHEEIESLTSSTVEIEQTTRGNLYLSYVSEWNESVKASLVAYFQPKIAELDDHHLKLNAGLATAIESNLDLQLEYELNHDNLPPAGVKPTDSVYTTSLKWSL